MSLVYDVQISPLSTVAAVTSACSDVFIGLLQRCLSYAQVKAAGGAKTALVLTYHPVPSSPATSACSWHGHQPVFSPALLLRREQAVCAGYSCCTLLQRYCWLLWQRYGAGSAPAEDMRIQQLRLSGCSAVIGNCSRIPLQQALRRLYAACASCRIIFYGSLKEALPSILAYNKAAGRLCTAL